MLLRAVAVWLGILLLASINGGIRALILLVTPLTIDWIHPGTTGEARAVGVLWVTLTPALELGAGHDLFRKPWATLLEDYDLRRGRIWVAVLVVMSLAPV